METALAQKTDMAEQCQFLTFTVGDSEYGVAIMSVREIRGWTDATRLPNRPPYMRGVINLRGSIIPIFDLRCRFMGDLTTAHPKNVIVILSVEEKLIGLLVDAVSDIVTVTPHDIKEAPQQDDIAIDNRFIDGLLSVHDRMVIILNSAQLLRADLTVADATEPTTPANTNLS